jgi:hypothetical protein
MLHLESSIIVGLVFTNCSAGVYLITEHVVQT